MGNVMIKYTINEHMLKLYDRILIDFILANKYGIDYGARFSFKKTTNNDLSFCLTSRELKVLETRQKLGIESRVYD